MLIVQSGIGSPPIVTVSSPVNSVHGHDNAIQRTVAIMLRYDSGRDFFGAVTLRRGVRFNIAFVVSFNR